jgi:hypothetical protein
MLNFILVAIGTIFFSLWLYGVNKPYKDFRFLKKELRDWEKMGQWIFKKSFDGHDFYVMREVKPKFGRLSYNNVIRMKINKNYPHTEILKRKDANTNIYYAVEKIWNRKEDFIINRNFSLFTVKEALRKIVEEKDYGRLFQWFYGL